MENKIRHFTKEELIEFLKISLNTEEGGFYGLLKQIEVGDPDEIFTKIQEKLAEKNKEDKVSSEYLDNLIKENQKTPAEEEVVISEPTLNIPVVAPGQASIYAEEHIPAVQEDLAEQAIQTQPKVKVLEPSTPVSIPPVEGSKPNPWGDAQVVSPGQLKL